VVWCVVMLGAVVSLGWHMLGCVSLGYIGSLHLLSTILYRIRHYTDSYPVRLYTAPTVYTAPIRILRCSDSGCKELKLHY
jgi:hypothetical protein